MGRNIVVILVTAIYPFAVYFGLDLLQPRWVAVLLFVMAVLRAIDSKEMFWRYVAVLAFILAGWSFLFNHSTPLKLYPVLVSAVLLAVFSLSLWKPPTVIERLARLQTPDLPESGVAYTRKVTWVWCGFFIINASISTFTAFYASTAAWTLYNGLISYLLMGVLFAVEWIVRQRVRAREQ